jgi:hypothetical protein
MLAGVDGIVFLYCPMCGGGYTSVEDARVFANVQSIDVLAPAGFHPATEAELREHGWWSLVTDRFSEDDWTIP